MIDRKHLIVDPVTVNGVRWGRHLILETFPKAPKPQTFAGMPIIADPRLPPGHFVIVPPKRR